MISAIVAVDNNWGIGFNGDLLEYIPEDLKMFKQLTLGHTVIMGRKTWNSLPKAPLPERDNIVISSTEPLIMAKNTLRLPLEAVIEFLEYTNDEIDFGLRYVKNGYTSQEYLGHGNDYMVNGQVAYEDVGSQASLYYRPVVILNSNVEFVKESDGSWSIK
jgi:hypothetical protein